MGQNAVDSRGAHFWISVSVTMGLALAAGTLIPWLLMALGREDVEAIESPLLLAVARQLVQGPGELYGPYDGRNPLVLIHAPLYYRLAALLAWPMARAGLDQVTAALVSGRMISMAGMAATLAGAFFLARLREAPRSAGWWAVLLGAATPVYSGLPFEVRPDMLGIGLQTWAVVLLLAALWTERPVNRAILLSFVCFALAACVKQQFVVTTAVSSIMLLAAWARGRVGLRTVAGALLCFLAIVSTYYGLEEWGTGGRMSRAVFAAARETSVIHPADWQNVINFVLALCWKCVGMILVFAAAKLVRVSATAGRGSRFLTAAGSGLIGLVAALAVVQFFDRKMWVSVSIVLGLAVIVVCYIPACVVALGRARRIDGIDAALLAYCLSELALTAVLFRLSTGAWYNYAVQGVVFACIVGARSLARALEGPLAPRALFGVALAVVAVPVFALTDVKEILARRQAERAALEKLLARIDGHQDAFFFVDRPGFNRVHGRPSLVYDPWLYPVFESMNLAEPRSVWLARALETGPVRIVVASSPQVQIEGLSRTLPEMGYIRFQVGPWFVWMRQIRQADAASDRGSVHVRLGAHGGRIVQPAIEFRRNPFSGRAYLLHSWDTTKEFAGCRVRAPWSRAKKDRVPEQASSVQASSEQAHPRPPKRFARL